MRFINPCSRKRGMRLGCQVRFMDSFPFLHLRYLVDYSGYKYRLSNFWPKVGAALSYLRPNLPGKETHYAVLKRNSTRPSLISSLSCNCVGVLPVSRWRLKIGRAHV